MSAVCRQPLLFALFLFLWPLTTQAARPPHIIVILVEHLALADITSTALPHLANLRDTGDLALVSPGSPRQPNPLANAYATCTAGDVINTKNPNLGLLQRTLASAGVPDRVKLIEFGDARAPGRLTALDGLIGKAENDRSANEKLMVCSVVPPQDAHGGWDRLTVMLVSGLAPAGGTLTSDTTHTPGLIALRDIAPTILSWANAPIPVSMTGAPAHTIAVPDRGKLLAHLDSLTQLNQHILLPLAWFLGCFGGFALLGTIYALASKKRIWPAGLRYLLRSVIAFPLAALIAPLGNPQTVLVYALLIIALDLLLALIPSAGALCALTAAVLVVDGLTGAHLTAQAALSGYWLPGIRFYGIGNEYMGVLLGMALVAGLTPRPPSRPTPPLRGTPPASGGGGSVDVTLTSLPRLHAGLLALWFMLVIFTLSFPEFGAKAGGAVAAMVCFAPAWFALAFGKRIGWVSFALSAIAGFGLIFLWAVISHALGLRETHIQAAATALSQDRFGYIGHVALRKAKMAVRIFLHPGVFLTLAGLVLTYLIWRRSDLPKDMAAFLQDRPNLAIGLRAGAWGILATLIFNDSGTVAAFFLFGVLAISFLHEMLVLTPRPSSEGRGEKESIRS
jgi:hypothetical protein